MEQEDLKFVLKALGLNFSLYSNQMLFDSKLVRQLAIGGCRRHISYEATTIYTFQTVVSSIRSKF